jgi:hypothetical protein
MQYQQIVGLNLTVKKFYHEVDINAEHKKYFGFMYQME